MDIIDLLLVFWAVLALVVFTAGNIFGTKKGINKRKGSSPADRSQLASNDQWSPISPKGAAAYYNDGGDASNRNQQHHHQSLGHQQQVYSNNNKSVGGDYSFSSTFATQQQQNNLAAGNGQYTTDPYGKLYQRQPDDQYVPGHPRYSSEQRRLSDYNNNNSDYYGTIGAYKQPRFQEPSSRVDLQQVNMGAANSISMGGSSIIPTASGYNGDCIEWVNSILYLFHTRQDKYGPIIAESINRSLNEKVSSILSLSTDYSDLIIEFNSINLDSSSKPELTNIRTESESERSVSVNCKIYNKRVSFNIATRLLSPIASASSASAAAAAAVASEYNRNYDAQQEQLVQYELILENLEGKLKSMAMLNDKLIVIQFLERPDTKILLRRQYDSFVSTHRSSSPPLINEDTLVQIILQTLTQVVVDLYFGDDVDFPQYKQTTGQHHNQQSTYSNYKNKINTMFKGSASELKRQFKHDFFGALSNSSSVDKERKLFIKIVRAKNINYNQNVSCLLELDTPQQQAISSIKQGSNPFWDEHFLFTANEKSNELVLELWDSINQPAIIMNDQQQQQMQANTRKGATKSSASSLAASKSSNNKWHKKDLIANAKFLGLARVSIDELRQNPVQKLNLILQPIGAPTDLSNSVGGELQAELLFLEHSVSPTGTSADRNSSSLRKSQSVNSLSYQQGDVVSIDRKLTPSGFVITTTTITKQQQQAANTSSPTKSKSSRNNQQPLDQHQHQQNQLSSSMVATQGQNSQSPSPHPSMAITERSDQLDDLNLDGLSSSHVSTDLNQHHQQQHDRSSMAPSESTGGRLSRSRSRSRSFLRAIKKRFSFSRTRSRSVGESAGGSGGSHRGYQPDTRPGDSPSALGANELPNLSMGSPSRASSEVSLSGRAKSMPASRDPGELPTIVINKSRLSDTASALSFTHPKSQLVIEVMEPTLRSDGSGNKQKGRLRYYAVSDDAPNKRKWSKRGVKLHVFNEHQFVACHLPGSCTCHLCGRVFSKRPGKQGYKCRNCELLSHKQCHVKVDHNCPYASRDGLKLEYIDSDPPAYLIDELNQVAPHPTDQENNQHIISSEIRENYQQHQRAPQIVGRLARGKPIRITTKSISMEVDDR